MAQPVFGTVQSGSVLDDEKKDDDHFGFPQYITDGTGFDVCFGNIDAADEKIQKDDDDIDEFAGHRLAVDEIKADGGSEGSRFDGLASGVGNITENRTQPSGALSSVIWGSGGSISRTE